MKRTFDPAQLTEFLVKAGLITALAAALLMPTTVRLHGNELASDTPGPLLGRTAWETLPLPPIPHLETMPWLTQQRGHKSFKIDTLLGPRFELLGPAMAQPVERDRALSHSQAKRADLPWNG